MNTKNAYQNGFRFLILFFWTACIALFLFTPYFFSLWQDEREITLLTWGATIDPQILLNFERDTGIKINIRYFESNEELYVKLATARDAGYDLIMPSDYVTPKLVDKGLLKKIDKTKLTFWNELNPSLLNHYFDPGNQYSIPYYFGIYGLGINKTFFKEKILPASWSSLFNPKLLPGRIAMPSAARETISIAMYHLFGQIKPLNAAEIQKVTDLLIKQKEWVETYVDTDIRTSYLVMNETCPVVVTASPYIIKAMKEDKALDFLVPNETFMLIDSLAIPATSTKEDLVYELLNYLFKPDMVKHHFEHYPFLPATKNLRELMEADHVAPHVIDAHFDTNKKLHFFKDVLSEQQINDIWVALKTI